MNVFYTLTLIIGVVMAFVMQFVTIALPRDAFVATELSKSPNQWSIQMDENMTAHLSQAHLSHNDVKAELVKALHIRSQICNEIYKQSLWQGLALIAFSIIGLIREKKIQKMNMIEPSTAPYSEPATRSPQG